MALIHNGKEEIALEIIKGARKNKHRCEFQSGMFSDSYTYIRRWCSREKSICNKVASIVKKLFETNEPDR